MTLLDKLEKKIGRFALPNLTIYLIAGQTFFYVLFMTGKLDRSVTFLTSGLLLSGEWWRAATFLFAPPRTGPLFVLFAWYIFYLMGAALEEQWGAFRYNVFILIGYVLTVLVTFASPGLLASNTYIGGSVFLAFAFLYPDFILQLFFIIPVKIKWLALLTWIYYGYQILFGGWHTALLVFAAIGNFLIFFSRDIVWLLKSGRRQAARQVRRVAGVDDGPIHRCTVCGITDKSHPEMDFRYCQDCEGQRGYCREHIFNHEHL